MVCFISGSSGASGEECLANLGLHDARELGGRSLLSTKHFSPDLPGKAYANLGNWQLVLDPMMFVELDEPPFARDENIWPKALESRIAANRCDVVSFLISGASATYGFSRYLQGACQRRYVIQAGEFKINHGEPLPDESEVFTAHAGNPEDATLALVERLTLPFPQLATVKFSVYQTVFAMKSVEQLQQNAAIATANRSRQRRSARR